MFAPMGFALLTKATLTTWNPISSFVQRRCRQVGKVGFLCSVWSNTRWKNGPHHISIRKVGDHIRIAEEIRTRLWFEFRTSRLQYAPRIRFLGGPYTIVAPFASPKNHAIANRIESEQIYNHQQVQRPKSRRWWDSRCEESYSAGKDTDQFSTDTYWCITSRQEKEDCWPWKRRHFYRYSSSNRFRELQAVLSGCWLNARNSDEVSDEQASVENAWGIDFYEMRRRYHSPNSNSRKARGICLGRTTGDGKAILLINSLIRSVQILSHCSADKHGREVQSNDDGACPQTLRTDCFNALRQAKFAMFDNTSAGSTSCHLQTCRG